MASLSQWPVLPFQRGWEFKPPQNKPSSSQLLSFLFWKKNETGLYNIFKIIVLFNALKWLSWDLYKALMLNHSDTTVMIFSVSAFIRLTVYFTVGLDS